MKSTIMILAIILAGCGNKDLKIDSFEELGFTKEVQPLFQMVGAIDGWKGTYKNEQAEIYFYEDKSKLPLEQFKNMTKSNSRVFCNVQNTLIIEDAESLCIEAKNKFN